MKPAELQEGANAPVSMARKTSANILWNFFEQLARKGVGIFVTLILAYFLTPDAYGLLAMVMVFITLGTSVMQSGFSQALIRMPEVTQADYNTAFYANILLGLLSYFLLFLAAPLIAGFYQEPALTLLIRIISLSIIINSFQVVQQANLSRALNFKAQMKAVLPASIISGVLAIIFAYFGFGVWALVIQILTSALLQTCFLWLIQGWRPTFLISLPSLGDMYRFGYKLFLSGVLDTLFQNAYILVVAKLFSSSIAGLYFFSNQIVQLIVQQLVSSIQTVTYPALSKYQNNPERLAQNYRRVLKFSVFLMFPAMLFLVVLAESLFEILLPDRWHEAVEYLQILCIAAAIIPLHSVNLNILKIKGRSDLYLVLELIKKVIGVIVLIVSLRWGMKGLLLGQVLTSFLSYIPNAVFSKKLIGYSIVSQLKDARVYGCLALLIAAFGYVTQSLLDMSAVLVILTLGPLMSLLYLSGCYLFEREELMYVVNTLIKKKLNVPLEKVKIHE